MGLAAHRPGFAPNRPEEYERLVARPAGALRLAKRLIDEGSEMSIAEALDAEVEIALSTLGTGEPQVTTSAFRER